MEASGANWYSIRHTFGDFLAGRVADFAISAVMEHTSITISERDRLFARGSPTTEIYKRQQLQLVLDVGEALEAEWWPEIVKRWNTWHRADRRAQRVGDQPSSSLISIRR
ncbi:hypothetical protein [Paracoccus luteus]|uniref:hypothetical protein n=1 Tax=Paracoccus luteus TaxID=2508543 RepID=UPI00107030F0|nr:hypothetical protein [Paracoccus luteus]